MRRATMPILIVPIVVAVFDAADTDPLDRTIALQQALTFLLTGDFTDLCNGGPCQCTVVVN